MLGAIELEDPWRAATNKFAKFEYAIISFGRVTNFPNRLVPLAMGRIADCHFQLAAQDTNRYELATNQYWQVILSPLADAATRSQAEVGLGQALEKMAMVRTNRTELLNQALTHYLNVVYAKRSKEEDQDPYWLGQAAQTAGTLAVEQLQLYEPAERLYQSMMIKLPSLRSVWEKRLATLREQRRNE